MDTGLADDRGIQNFVINELIGQDAGRFHSFLWGIFGARNVGSAEGFYREKR